MPKIKTKPPTLMFYQSKARAGLLLPGSSDLRGISGAT